MTAIRTRFAPSPTGYLHIGGARTALFNWLFARHHGGTFVLRIEDTDAERSTQEAIDAIINSMKWLGLDWDEGPFYQTQRYELYRQYAYQLLDAGNAYKCYCTPQELEQKRARAQAEGKPFGYDRACRDRRDQPAGQPFTIRFKVPTDGVTVVHDLVQGEVTFPNAELDDLIIVRSDGSPTYNFCVVVDDVSMNITHVIRGNDHLSNTPKQILMYEAMKFPVPQFAHIPLILGKDKSKLSKRHAAVSVMAYPENGFLPEALVNYLARLGWSYGDQEIFSMQELIEKFSLDNVGQSAGVFDTDKLLWLNQHYQKAASNERLAALLLPHLAQRYAPSASLTADSAWLHRIIELQKERSRTLAEMADAIKYYFVEPAEYDAKAAKKALTPAAADVLHAFLPQLEELETFDVAHLEERARLFSEQNGLKLGDIAQPIRVAVTGGGGSPGLFDVLALLGKPTVIQRIRRAIDWIRAQPK